MLPQRALLILLTALITQGGCVHRRLTIRTNPAGAVAYVDNRRIGITPVSTSFRYYGTRHIQLVKDGFATVTEDHKIAAPWYQWFGIDFFADNLWPREIRDERILDFQMTPQQVIPPAQVLQRAEQLRSSAEQGLLTPAPPLKHSRLKQHMEKSHSWLQPGTWFKDSSTLQGEPPPQWQF